ncbi:MAG: hypothetical protein JW818_21585 [Pirellulales bacterium]|nr:hypothetical protein [Pirellulales bacterium]
MFGLLLLTATAVQAQQVMVLNDPHNVAQLGTATAPGNPGVDPSFTIDDRISVALPTSRDYFDRVHFLLFDTTQPYQIDVDLGGAYDLTALQAYVPSGDSGGTFPDTDRTVSQVEFFVDQGSGFTSVGLIGTSDTDDIAGFDLTQVTGNWTGVTNVRYEFTKSGTYAPRIAEVLAICPTANVTYLPQGGQESGLVLDGGGLALVEEGGTMDVDKNIALASKGAVAFGTMSYPAPPTHQISNVNDGQYGNAHSWVAYNDNADGKSFIGINLNGSHAIDSVAFGSANVEGDYADRWATTFYYEEGYDEEYTLQYTTVANPDETTSDEDWVTIGTLDYIKPGGENFFEPALRHRFTFDPVTATGVRLIVPFTYNSPHETNHANRIDEFEVYEVPEPGAWIVLLGALATLAALRKKTG